MSYPPPHTARMKNIIHDQKHTVSGVVASTSSFPANQNSKNQNGRTSLVSKIPPLSLTPRFSDVGRSFPASPAPLFRQSKIENRKSKKSKNLLKFNFI